ncbi:two-component system response regulator BtsR [Ferrimonas balearica]|uniref:two-component system response regulator BtsR n=1 Tax=Ferrimonas balearica TaxID=44012 RepID=UPI001C5A2090|nr:two-component system response regulator BtsR [Ferrimonas balearica]MBW3140035.1 two-component system response regulator BtsR [Ferrimonas balearica]MBW3165059.1 two-component system response regulator BtsR [Ferrimonas balearica]MBY6106857.1 two-component system response regulator BtsR [Ferrimonas balearica]
MIRTLLIDDEPLAREELAILLEHHDDIEIVGEANNAIEGMAQINQLKPDLVFLDIQMPKITGMEMLAMLDPATMPRVVFVTAYDQHAVAAFEKNAFDYLLKPVVESRLATTLERVRAAQSPQQPLAEVLGETIRHLPCYQRNTLKVVRMEQVEYVFSDLSGVHVATAADTSHTQLTLKVLEERSPLIRCHRQYLVNPEAIAAIRLQEGGYGEIETHSGQKLPVSRRYMKGLKQTFGFQ